MNEFTVKPHNIHIGCDHAAVDLKNFIVALLKERGHEVIDHGVNTTDSCDYPDIAHEVCRAMEGRESTAGILLCGTGIGMSIAANRHPHIRAALCTTELHASLARRHNNANMLCMGARVTGVELARAILRTFLETDFEGGRHQRRVDKLGI
ncbi:MAG: ribose 5-phosphate isomerase B [Desulfovibrionaceae bacterium]|nr:ribose 5-phosphate isomerase B [Desulfovibrionaceae bacterium]